MLRKNNVLGFGVALVMTIAIGSVAVSTTTYATEPTDEQLMNAYITHEYGDNYQGALMDQKYAEEDEVAFTVESEDGSGSYAVWADKEYCENLME